MPRARPTKKVAGHHLTSIITPIAPAELQRNLPSQNLSSNLNRPSLAIYSSRVNLLAGLGDLLKDSLVGEVGDDLGALVLEGHVVAFDAAVR